MRVVICYDVNDDKIRRKLVKYLEAIAVRVQYSVFVSDLSEKRLNELKKFVDELLNESVYGNLMVFKIFDYDGVIKNLLPANLIYI